MALLPERARTFKAMGRVIWSSSADTPQGLPAELVVQFLNRDTQGQTLSERFVVE